MSSRPNVLLVIADQWRQQSTGFGGNSEVKTPCLDKFAQTAVHLPHAVASCPVCTPWRATLLTGMTPDKHGLFLNDAPLDPSLPTIGKQFKAAGYDTGWIGKWHVDGHGRMRYIPPERRQGFDYWKVLECTHRYNESYYYEGDDPEHKVWDGYDAIAQTNDAIEWLGTRESDRPFFLGLSWGPPHSPFHTAPEEYRSLYEPGELTLGPNVPEDMAEGARENLAGYYAHCSALDACFGRLMDCLDEMDLVDNTIVVFTSDHGEFCGSHGIYDKQGPWDESVRVPLLIRWPEGLGRDGNTSNLVFETTDFYPTLCAMADVPTPEGVLQGRNCTEWLRSGTVPENNDGLIASYHVFGNWPKQAAGRGDALIAAREYRGLRTPRYTYVEDLNGPWLLYDNVADPYQVDNLIGRPDAGPVQQTLASRLHAKLEELGDEFLPGWDYVARWGYKVKENGTLGWPDEEEWARLGC